MKNQYGREKTKRLSGRISESFQIDLQRLAKQTGVSQADLLELAFYNMYDRRHELFICCPNCKAPYYPEALISVSGTLLATCNECGTDFEYNDDEDF